MARNNLYNYFILGLDAVACSFFQLYGLFIIHSSLQKSKAVYQIPELNYSSSTSVSHLSTKNTLTVLNYKTIKDKDYIVIESKN